MYCELCGSKKSDPNAACENCLSGSPAGDSQTVDLQEFDIEENTAQPKKSVPGWAIVLIVALSGGLLVQGLFMTGVFNNENPLAAPVEDSEIDVDALEQCLEETGYEDLVEKFGDTFDDQARSLELDSGLEESVRTLKSGGSNFTELGEEFASFPHCGSQTFLENNTLLGESLITMGETLEDLPTDLSNAFEIALILGDMQELISDITGTLDVQKLWLLQFVDL